MKIRTMAASALVAVVPLTAVTACSTSDSSSTSSTISSTAVAKSFQVATPQGQVSLSLDGELPPGWPGDLPVPSSAKPAGSGSLGGSDSAVRVAVYTTSGPGQETLDFYTGNAKLTTASPSAAGAGQSFVGSVDLVSPYDGSVTVLSRDGKGYLVVILKDAGGSTSSSTSTSTTTG